MLKKMVDGKEVICSAEEEAAIRAEWAANDAKKALEDAEEADKRQRKAKAKDLLKNKGKGPVTRAEFDALLDALDL